jgi:hypothetical protein
MALAVFIELHPQNTPENLNIRITFRRIGEEILLLPTGVDAGVFIPYGTLDIASELMIEVGRTAFML